MQRIDLASYLVQASHAEREALLRENSALADRELAFLLKNICLEGWSSEPQRALSAAAVLKSLAEINADPEIAALTDWGAGLADLIHGQMERAISHLDTAEARFLLLGKEHLAAATQISKLIALAMLGRYEEAIECGLNARSVMLLHGDTLSAGKLEHNIGNIYFRRDLYMEAEQFQRAARERFLALGDEVQLAKIENSLALTESQQHKIDSAELLYEQSLRRAEAAGLLATQAEVLSSIGNMALFQGRYDRALDFLERSRRKYLELGSPHQSALTEQEIADAYLELNLAPEAAAIYERLAPTFAELGMRAERARALAYHGRARVLLGDFDKAHALLHEARELYAAEGNAVGEATVRLTEAQLYYKEENYKAASRAATVAEAPLKSAGAKLRELQARWLRGESLRALGDLDEARALLESTLRESDREVQPQVTERCYTSLGLLAEMTGDRKLAEDSFKRAVTFIESLRAPLPAEEFRTAFFADKLVPYDELVRLCLTDESRDRRTEALGFVERARARSLVDALGERLSLGRQPRDSFETELLGQYQRLREELNYFYNQMNRPAKDGVPRGMTEMMALRESLREREDRLLEIMRQLRHSGSNALAYTETFDLAQLQSDLGTGSALVEYISIDGQLLAFVVTQEKVEVIRHLGREEEVRKALEQFRFQMEALRYGAEPIRKHLASLEERVRYHLSTLYDLLLRPIEERLGNKRLIVVPFRALHYIPFHALDDGTGYVIERREVCYAPSAVVLRYCLSKPHRPLRRALFLGVADEQTPRVHEEVQALAPLFPEATVLLDSYATLNAVKDEASAADVLHLACHGHFRPDNPLFSALRLGDGWLTVSDAYDLNLQCELVTLSACETGVNEIAPGEELIGLARGFLSAGAPSLVLSLWTVDDETTSRLMVHFYTRLLAGASPCAALRHAQLQLLQEQSHPFFWSPFALFGRW